MIEHRMTLITLDGESITIDIPEDDLDEVLEDFRNTSYKDFWNVGNWINVSCWYKGIPLDEINMNQIIGIVQ